MGSLTYYWSRIFAPAPEDVEKDPGDELSWYVETDDV